MEFGKRKLFDGFGAFQSCGQVFFFSRHGGKLFRYVDNDAECGKSKFGRHGISHGRFECELLCVFLLSISGSVFGVVFVVVVCVESNRQRKLRQDKYMNGSF